MHWLDGMGELSDLLIKHCPFICSDRKLHVRMEPQHNNVLLYSIRILALTGGGLCCHGWP